MTESIDETWLITAKSEKLNPRQLEMYREHRRDLLTWMLDKGQNPDVNIGYAEETVENRGYRLDMFYRWVWDVEDGDTDDITESHANAFMKYLHPQSYSQAYKAAFQKSIKPCSAGRNTNSGNPLTGIRPSGSMTPRCRVRRRR